MSNRIGGSAIDSKRIPEEENSWQQENRIVKYLQQLKFKKKLFGVDEADVWKKIQELNHMYEESLKATRSFTCHSVHAFVAPQVSATSE